MPHRAKTIDGWARLVRDATAHVRASALRPSSFFVARSGVLTLAFVGFPEALLSVKTSLEAQCDDLLPENPGSLWPKCTLAALRKERRLAPAEVEFLREITTDCDRRYLAAGLALPVRELEVAELLNRSAERIGRSIRIPLEMPPDEGRIAAAHRLEVRQVLDQWRGRSAAYAKELDRSGFREPHYRGAHHEYSLILRPGDDLPGIQALKERVEDGIPGAFAWFSEESRHVTLRTLG